MKKLITNYQFSASTGKVTLTDYDTLLLEGVLLITNVTDNVIIYNFADATKGGTVSGNVITLDYNTSTMDNADILQVFYDDGGLVQIVELSEAIKTLARVIANPSNLDKTTNRAQVAVTGSLTTLTTCTTCGTVTSITGIDGYQGKMLMIANNYIAWNALVRARIT